MLLIITPLRKQFEMASHQDMRVADPITTSEPAVAHQMPTEQLPTNGELEAVSDTRDSLPCIEPRVLTTA